jgi:malonate-semialdehyde dehydrogenase (acetylating) / methylmalonate-semialdehyde dehydrogenase
MNHFPRRLSYEFHPRLAVSAFSRSITASNEATISMNVSSKRLLVASRSMSTWSSVFPPELPSDAAWFDRTSNQYKIFTDQGFALASSSSSSSSHEDTSTNTVTNPATQQVLGTVPNTPLDVVDDVVYKAHTAYEQWQYVSVQQRQRVLFEYLRLIKEHSDELAYLITLENGKTLKDAQGDVFRGLEVVETACQVAPHLSGSAYAGLSTHVDMTTIREPLGVCVGVAPFNFPAMIPLWMFPLAIACGNAFVLKPSEKTPSTALYLAELWTRTPSPANLLQMVHGDAPVAHALVQHPHTRALSFVGSTRAGLALAQTAAASSTRCQANLGAKNHAVILPDSRTASTARALAGAALGAAGQRCMALSVVILVRQDATSSTSTDGELDDFVQEIVKCAREYNLGSGWDTATDIGPLITKASKDRVISIVTQAETQGARIVLDGRSCSVPDYKNGNFVGPTILQLASTDNVAYQEEIFGPVLCVLTVDTLDDAIDLINTQNVNGNGTALFTTSGAAARTFTRRIQVGQVGINVPIPVPLPMGSFTGSRASFHGDLNFYGPSGVHFFTQLKTITSQWIYPSSSDSPSSQASSSSSGGVRAGGPDLGGVTMPTVK